MGLILKYNLFTFTLISFCIFVATPQLKRNLKLFIYDKALPMGSISERDVTPVFDCGVNPKGSVACKNFFEMTPKKEFVTTGAHAGVTPTQQSHTDFYLTFFNNLPNCYTQEEAFVKANVQHFNRFGKFRYLTFKSFRNGRA